MIHNLPLKLQPIAEKILALRRLTKQTNFQTSRSQSELLKPLSPEELAQVAIALEAAEAASAER